MVEFYCGFASGIFISIFCLLILAVCKAAADDEPSVPRRLSRVGEERMRRMFRE